MKTKKEKKDYQMKGMDGYLQFQIQTTDISDESTFEDKVDYLLKLGLETYYQKDKEDYNNAERNKSNAS